MVQSLGIILYNKHWNYRTVYYTLYIRTFGDKTVNYDPIVPTLLRSQLAIYSVY